MFKNMFNAILFFAALVATGVACAAPVGYVHAVKGVVTLRDAGKQPTQAKPGDTFEQGANFTTGANGEVTLKFEDGEVAMLAPNTVFIATTYVYNKAKVADGNIVFNLLRGGLRFVSGVMAETNPAKFAIRTPTATAGVRGSAAIIGVSQDGQTTTAAATKGLIILSAVNPATGQTTTVQLSPGQFSTTGPGQPVTAPQAMAQMTSTPGLAGVALLVQVLGSASAPPNNPVNVNAVANAITLAIAAAADPSNAALQQQAAAALQTAVTENQAAIAAAIAGGAAAGSGTDTGGAVAPAVISNTTVPTAPNTPAALAL